MHFPKKLNIFFIPHSPIPGGENPFSVAFNSLYNYGNSDGTAVSNNISAGNTNSQLAVARSTSTHNLDLEQENKRRKDLEYK